MDGQFQARTGERGDIGRISPISPMPLMASMGPCSRQRRAFFVLFLSFCQIQRLNGAETPLALGLQPQWGERGNILSIRLKLQWGRAANERCVCEIMNVLEHVPNSQGLNSRYQRMESSGCTIM